MEIMEYYAVNNGQNNTELGLKWCKGDLSLVLRTRRSGVRIPSSVPHIKSLKPSHINGFKDFFVIMLIKFLKIYV